MIFRVEVIQLMNEVIELYKKNESDIFKDANMNIRKWRTNNVDA